MKVGKRASKEDNGMVATNTAAIVANTVDIDNNAVAIGINTKDIGTNTKDIGTNAKDIGTNAKDIGTNAHDIGTNAEKIEGIGTNSNNIVTNANNIDTNANNIDAIIRSPILLQLLTSNGYDCRDGDITLCGCAEGFKFNTDQGCVDNNECEVDYGILPPYFNPCEEGTSCVNKVGSFCCEQLDRQENAQYGEEMTFTFMDLPKSETDEFVILRVELFGDFGNSGKYAKISIGGTTYQVFGGEVEACSTFPTVKDNEIPTGTFNSWFSEVGSVTVNVELSSDVVPVCDEPNEVGIGFFYAELQNRIENPCLLGD